jgi:hypothetical protein
MYQFYKKCTYASPVIFLLILFACNSTVNDSPAPETPTSEVAHVRLIHSASSSAGLDFTYKDVSDNYYYVLQEDATYGNQYGYFDLYTGQRQLKVYLSNSQIAVADITLSLVKDQKYTLVACDYEATINPKLLAFDDTLAIPESEMSYVRFIHAGADVSRILVSDNDDDTTVAALDRLQASAYIKLPSQTYRFRASTNQPQDILIEDIPVTFLPGQNYSIVFSGSVSGLTAIGFNAKVYRETSL